MKKFILGAFGGFFVAFLLGADSIPHPTPATASATPVGNGTKWVTTAIPACTSVQCLSWDGGAFGCIP